MSTQSNQNTNQHDVTGHDGRVDRKRSKTFNLMKLAICVGVGVALGLMFHEKEIAGIPPASFGAAIGVAVAYIWSKSEREGASRSSERG